jgi:2-dehydro-3-deoxyphosphooctonate aldolase (KDO 8-P synthase)
VSRLAVAGFEIGAGCPLALIAGPCVIESLDLCMRVAHHLTKVCERLQMPLLFKSSYDKANRMSLGSFRGPGLELGLEILRRVGEEFNVPVYTDIHHPEEAQPASEVCAALQIPAFLCRQTDLLVAAARAGKPVTIKKGQFMAPWDMRPLVEKVRQTAEVGVMLIDRGVSFGYNNLVADMRAMPILKEVGECPVCFDATHATQLPGGHGSHSAGQSEFVGPLALAAVAAGADALFLECHPTPLEAKSDAGAQLPLEAVEPLLRKAQAIHAVITESSLPVR